MKTTLLLCSIPYKVCSKGYIVTGLLFFLSKGWHHYVSKQQLNKPLVVSGCNPWYMTLFPNSLIVFLTCMVVLPSQGIWLYFQMHKFVIEIMLCINLSLKLCYSIFNNIFIHRISWKTFNFIIYRE